MAGPVATLLFVIPIVGGQAGCATTTRTDERLAVGTVGVVLVPYTRPLMEVPAKGSGEGAARGAAAVGHALDRGIFVILAPVGAAIGAAVGAAAAEDAAKVNEAERALLAALRTSQPLDAVRKQLIEQARARPRVSVIALPGPLETQGADSVLELRLLAFHLKGHGSVDPPFTLMLRVHTRLIRLSDGTHVDDKTFNYESRKLKFIEWAADGSRALREEVDRAAVNLGKEIRARLDAGDPAER